MENIWTLLPFFDVGVIAAVLARFTGMNLSMAVRFRSCTSAVRP